LLAFLLLLFRDVMSDGTAGRRAQDGMMASHMTCYGSDNGTFDATLRLSAVRADQESQQGYGYHRGSQCNAPRHVMTPSVCSKRTLHATRTQQLTKSRRIL
jgi:hypothetical protein